MQPIYSKSSIVKPSSTIVFYTLDRAEGGEPYKGGGGTPSGTPPVGTIAGICIEFRCTMQNVPVHEK